jgi:hypothetical protein
MNNSLCIRIKIYLGAHFACSMVYTFYEADTISNTAYNILHGTGFRFIFWSRTVFFTNNKNIMPRATHLILLDLITFLIFG